MPAGVGTDKIMHFIHLRVEEVKRRSHNVENHWSLNQTQKDGFGKFLVNMFGAFS